MSIETKQLHALSKIYQEAVYGGGKKESPKDTRMVVTNADKKANTKAYQNMKAGVKGYKAADHMKEGMKQARKNVGASTCWDGYKAKGTKKKGGKEVPNCVKEGEKKAKKDYDGDGKIESGKDEYFGSKDKAIKKAMGKKIKEGLSNWRHDLKEIPNYDQIPVDSKDRNKKIEEKKVKNTVKINPDMKEGYGDKKKKKKHDCASKVKHEEFGIGDCISEAHDLDENGNVAHYDVEFEKYIVKGIPVEELEILEGTMHEHVIREKHSADTKGKKNCGCGQNPCVTYGKQEDVKSEGYEATKTKEVMGALKKRNLKDKVKAKIAADIVKRKGDTSKSDDRYAYEGTTWEDIADDLTESDIADIIARLEKKRISKGGNPDDSPLPSMKKYHADKKMKKENYQAMRNPEKEEKKDKRSAKQKRMDSPDKGINSPAFKEFMRQQGM